MSIDVSAAADFMAAHARLLDRRRFRLSMTNLTLPEGDADPAGPSAGLDAHRAGLSAGLDAHRAGASAGLDADRAGLLAALDGYRNADGGYGWGLEPDLRSPESQPGAALHAFEVFEGLAPATTARAAELCDWLESVTLPDGGLPFALPVSGSGAGDAPWWAGADPGASSLQITAVTAAAAHRMAVNDPAVAAHPWLDRATRYCLASIEAIDETPHAYVLAFAVRFLDAVHETRSEAAGLLARLGRHLPVDGVVRVEGGTETESLRPLDFAPYPDRPARSLLDPRAVADDLDRLAAQQAPDGGWTVDYAVISPAGALDWRGHATVSALDILRRNSRL